MPDVFDRKTLNRVVQQRVYRGNFFLNTFFKPELPADTEFIEVDIEKTGGRKLAPVVSPVRGGVVVKKEGYEQRTFKAPYLHPKTIITPKDMAKRFAGENPYGDTITPEMRLARKVAKELSRLDDSIERRKEYYAAQSLLDGKTVVSGEGVDYEINYQRDSELTVTLTSTDLWSDAASDPIDDLRNFRRLLNKRGYTPDTLILGANVIKNFFAHQAVKDHYATSGFNIAQLEQTPIGSGVVYHGAIPEFGKIYSYNEWYFDEDTQTSLPLMPENKILLGDSSADNRLLHGAIQNMHAGGMAALEKFVDRKDLDGKGMELKMESAPLPALTSPDSVLVATVI